MAGVIELLPDLYGTGTSINKHHYIQSAYEVSTYMWIPSSPCKLLRTFIASLKTALRGASHTLRDNQCIHISAFTSMPVALKL